MKGYWTTLLSQTLLAGLLAGVGLVATARSQAAELTLTIVDAQGLPVPHAVWSVTAVDGSQNTPPAPGVIDQKGKQFVPHFIVVQQGAAVTFPNSDSIKHHVYSFSPGNEFELRLYKDQKPAPIVFNQLGVVELGCNIHDWMLGYIYVVDTPFFDYADQYGQVKMQLAEGKYRLSVWHPRIAKGEPVLAQELMLQGATEYRHQFSLPMRPDVDGYEQYQPLNHYD